MKYFVFLILSVSAFSETLRYSINWPSGLSLGEASLTSGKTTTGWDFTLDIDASFPGFPIRDHDEAKATTDFCSSSLDKNFTHGPHKVEEQVTFDQKDNVVTRETMNGGGKTEINVSACARDALTFLEFARHELAEGRIAPQQQAFFGGPYSVRLEYTGTQSIKVGDKKVDADRMLATIKGPSSEVNVELFFARDPARTPLLARLPLALGTFTVELIH
jgi:hypothetical protein